jgi:hypothetical protein
MSDQEHNVTVHYTIFDDGIWLRCSCGWEFCAGFEPPIEDLVLFADNHRVVRDAIGGVVK